MVEKSHPRVIGLDHGNPGRLYALNNRMMENSGSAFVEVVMGDEQTILVEKESYKAVRKSRESSPNAFDPEKGWCGLLPQLDFTGDYKLTCDLNKDAYASVVYVKAYGGHLRTQFSHRSPE